MPVNLTKEQLKNELISHGVQPPPTNSRKEEFIRLYEQHVAPIVSLKGDFSSDEENEVNEAVENQGLMQVNEATELICGGLNVAELSDEELFAQLQSFGIPVGPIVDTTRSIYQKKLAAILQKGSMVEATPEQSNGADEKFSDSEEDDVSVTELVVDSQTEQTEEAIESFETVESVEFVEAAEIAESADTVVAEPRVSTPSLTSIRKRTTERPGSSLNALPLVDKQGTPTPRPSIHSISSSSQYTYESRRLLDTIDGSSVLTANSSSGASPKAKIISYIFLFALLIVAAYITFTCANCNQVKLLVVNIKQKLSQYLEKLGPAAKRTV